MLLFCKSTVASTGKPFSPVASIVVILLVSAKIISSFFISYSTEGRVVNLMVQKEMKYMNQLYS